MTNCDLVAPTLTCTAIGVLGPESRTFYVSGNAVYLWVADFRDEPAPGRAGGVRLPPALRARAAVGDRRARGAGRSILVPRGPRRGHAERAGPRRGRQRRCDGRARGQRRPGRPAARADRLVRRRLAPGAGVALSLAAEPGRRRIFVPQPLRRRSCPLRRRRAGQRARGQERARRGRAGAGRPGGADPRSAMRSTGSRRSAATRSSSATGPTTASASPPSTCRRPAGRGAATSSSCPPRRKARRAATPSSSGRRRPTAPPA